MVWIIKLMNLKFSKELLDACFLNLSQSYDLTLTIACLNCLDKLKSFD